MKVLYSVLEDGEGPFESQRPLTDFVSDGSRKSQMERAVREYMEKAAEGDAI